MRWRQRRLLQEQAQDLARIWGFGIVIRAVVREWLIFRGAPSNGGGGYELVVIFLRHEADRIEQEIAKGRSGQTQGEQCREDPDQ